MATVAGLIVDYLRSGPLRSVPMGKRSLTLIAEILIDTINGISIKKLLKQGMAVELAYRMASPSSQSDDLPITEPNNISDGFSLKGRFLIYLCRNLIGFSER